MFTRKNAKSVPMLTSSAIVVSGTSAAMTAMSPAKTTSTPARPPMPAVMPYATAPTRAAAGSVTTQAVTMRRATLHRTSAPGLPTPLPRMEPVATWVVDSEKPKWLDSKMIAAEEVSAAIPCGDLISTKPLPSVRITRQPPR